MLGWVEQLGKEARKGKTRLTPFEAFPSKAAISYGTHTKTQKTHNCNQTHEEKKKPKWEKTLPWAMTSLPLTSLAWRGGMGRESKLASKTRFFFNVAPLAHRNVRKPHE